MHAEYYVPTSFIRKIKDIYNYTKKLYFPLWDINCEWKLQQLQAGEEHQYSNCDFKNKIIYVDYISLYNINNMYEFPNEPIVALLLHEMCHVITRRRLHDLRWCVKMLDSMKLARKTGNMRTARVVYAEVLDNASKEDIEKAETPFVTKKPETTKQSSRPRPAKRSRAYLATQRAQ